MSDPSPSSPHSEDTLYDPPDGLSAPRDKEPEEDTVALRLPLSKERTKQLRSVAQQLGLPPSVAAKRAIELVCGEVVTLQNKAQSSRVLIDQYQARLDLLHSIEDSDTNGTLEAPDD